ncbi:lysyl-tRNA synthetase [Elasticomyces elasticus]|nr:lysyl-tRNA synthetase [Elasticomyces elasticus]
MSEEPRRSGRATKGLHVKASSSPAPNAPNTQKATKNTKSKGKKAQPAEDDDAEEEAVRCICGQNPPDDKRAFIGCEACEVWQHNVCMGMPEEEEELPEHYLCEECDPKAHTETVAALEKGEPIWEIRTTKHRAWKKMSASRRKSKGKGAEEVRPSWWKKEIVVDVVEVKNGASLEPEETGSKRKRESVKPEPVPDAAVHHEEATTQAARPDKRRKSSQRPGPANLDINTAIVQMDKLPNDRKKSAEALSKVIVEDLKERVEAGFEIPDGFTTQKLGDHYASLIEYALCMNHGAPAEGSGYTAQFRLLFANLKRNKVLIEQLLEDTLTPDELATMEAAAMASEEKQREWKEMKEQADRQAVMMPDEGPRYRSSHKGLEKIEDERVDDFAGSAQPVRDRTEEDAGSPPVGMEGGAGSPVQADHGSAAGTNTRRVSVAPAIDRRTSSQAHFDMDNIWQKTSTAQSPTTGSGTRPMQMPPRRRSSGYPIQAQQQDNGAKDDPDVDRLLQDDDDQYEPSGYTSDETVVWQGRVVHTGEGEPLVNARFVAGRDMGSTASWKDVLPHMLSVDGRLAVQKAEEYLCGLQWSHNSDVSVLALTPADNMDEFNKVFEYFLSRGRYAVVNKDKPGMLRDIYIIPVEVGANLPEHIGMLEHNMIKTPVEERMLLATFVVTRAAVPQQADGMMGEGSPSQHQQQQQHAQYVGGVNGGQPPQVLPQHMRTGAPGPAGSPLTASGSTFSPSQPMSGYGTGLPPNPYEQHANALIASILGPRQWDPTALQVVAAQPDITEDKLRNLRRILEEDVRTRTDLEALAQKLGLQ